MPQWPSSGRSARRLAWLVGLSLLLSCSNLPDASNFHAGLTREQVRTTFGPPAHTQTMRKTSETIFGPIETFWAEVPRGSTVEIWAYRVDTGTVELYFVDGSDQVQGTGFAPTGAVY